MDNQHKINIELADKFFKQLSKLNDKTAKTKINTRINRIRETGNLGDAKSLGEGVYELRIHSGAGYRLYYTWAGKQLIILLAGGSKATQSKDIEQAKKLKKELEHEND